MAIVLASWSYASCAGSGDPVGTTISYRQARLRSTGALADVWLVVTDLPLGSDVSGRFDFFNPEDSTCYYISYTDPESTTPGHVITGWQDLTDRSDLVESLCGTDTPTWANARYCSDNTLMGQWKDITGLTLPYNFVLSDGTTCGYVDDTCPTTTTLPSPLITGETAGVNCDDPACLPGCSDNTEMTSADTVEPHIREDYDTPPRAPTWFNSGANFFPGFYRISFVAGALSYHGAGWGYSVSFTDHNYKLHYNNGAATAWWPADSAPPFASQALAEADQAGQHIDITHGGGKIGMSFHDTNIHDNCRGTTGPQFKIELLDEPG